MSIIFSSSGIILLSIVKIKKIGLVSFRNFRRKAVVFSPKTTVVVGLNASGKTNIVEAVYLLSTGKSFKAKLNEEMINHNQEIARVGGVFEGGEKLEAVLTRGTINIGTTREEKTPRKRLLVNGVGKRLFNFAGLFKTVLFGPGDLDLVTESPSVRRNFLDAILSQVDGEYRRAILSYEKGLRRRNKILYRIREEGTARSNLLFWNKLLVKNGDYVSSARQRLIDFINSTSAINRENFRVEYDKSAISEARLEQYAREEVAAATTLVGPHRDDFCLKLKKRKYFRALDRYGSRGEQRMGVLWLKLAELSFLESETEEKPTLLLDDIFSELDNEHREVVMKIVEGQQTIITTADPNFIKEFKRVEKIVLRG